MQNRLLKTTCIVSILFSLSYAKSEVYNALTSQKSYTITGTFGQHDFADADAAFDWAFTLKSNSKSYQLQGNEATDDNVFGWEEVNIDTPSPAWYMFALGGDVDRDGTLKYDWILAGVTTKAVYKLAGVSQSGNFLYSEPININYSVNGNTITFGQNPDAPIAENISLKADAATPYMQINLIATDPNGNKVSYFLDSKMIGDEGSGYTLAFIEDGTNTLYITFDDNTSKVVELSYVASDGQFFSDSATVTITKGEVSSYGYGANEISPEEYGHISLAYFDGSRYGTVGIDELDYPTSIDLSSSMPLPGNQGNQNSCVAWAVGYSLKSYHEKMEVQWSLDTPKTIFSPSWIYNQINGAKDNGSSIRDAMELIKLKGAATMSTMPYTDKDYLAKPSQEAINEAQNFKAVKYRRIGGSKQIKAALANRQPVVIIIKTYDSFNALDGDDSVYSTFSGEFRGNHGVTIVGYDDSKYGGAFKIINSWGRNWGSKGYFWLPYSSVKDVVRSSYVLSDAPNGEEIIVDIPTKPVDEKLPNLQVGSWQVDYNAQGGSLQFAVVNSGNSIAYPGADINLMFSKDATINSSDYYLVYETIETALAPGMAIYREEGNAREFLFPQNMEAGDYYMAMWVDDLDVIAESNESDNKSLSEFGTITVEDFNLPDLSIDWWFTEYTDDGVGALVYEVSNIGTADTDENFDISLILSSDEYLTENSTGFYVYVEPVTFTLEPGTSAARDLDSVAIYNLFVAPDGTQVTAGEYYVILFVDSLENITESNELNNYSVSNDGVNISYETQKRSATTTSSTKAHFNGTHMLHGANKLIQKVRISYDENGKREVRAIKNNLHVKKELSTQKQPYTKQITSRNQLIFPITKSVPMP
ncbi:MAG: C1 family peptidase [Campylobacterota bacterium]|nr:C1 family peptidase [Campylobacterota bacterium]